MPPVPVYTQSPITAAKASGVTPKTASPSAGNGNGSDAAPTSTSQLPRYAPVQPPPTATQNNDSPPPPQPGAVPRLPAVTSVAAPPQQGAPGPPEPTPGPPFPGSGPPPQMAMPAPAMNYSQRGTATATAPSNGPPGYQQQYAGFTQNNSNPQTGDGDGDGDNGVWTSAMRWAHSAGKKLSDAESEVWRRINGEGKQ